MAQYSRIEVATIMKESGMIPLFYHPDIELGKKVLKACYDGGARLMEFTARGDFAFEVFSELNKYAIKELPGMIMGVGLYNGCRSRISLYANGSELYCNPIIARRHCNCL